MPLPNWRTELPMMIPLALQGCNPVSILTDRPHHYQVSTPVGKGGEGWCGLGEKKGTVSQICSV